jgi:hypothetical protein
VVLSRDPDDAADPLLSGCDKSWIPRPDNASVRQSRHDLAGRQGGIVWLVTDSQHLFPLLFRQLVRRLRALRLRALILANLAGFLCPALKGAQAQAGFCAGQALPDTR